MDNGLIFPYPRRSVPAEASDADHPNHAPAFELVVWGAWDPDW